MSKDSTANPAPMTPDPEVAERGETRKPDAVGDAVYLVDKLGRFGAIRYAERAVVSSRRPERWARVLALLNSTDARQTREKVIAALRARY